MVLIRVLINHLKAQKLEVKNVRLISENECGTVGTVYMQYCPRSQVDILNSGTVISHSPACPRLLQH